MFDTPDVMRLAQDLARHSGARQSQIARNIANADTPGYRARDITSFADTLRGPDPGLTTRTTRDAHMVAGPSRALWSTVDLGGEASPNGNNVSLEQEMVRATRARSSHNTALAVYGASLDILRTSLGRGR